MSVEVASPTGSIDVFPTGTVKPDLTRELTISRPDNLSGRDHLVHTVSNGTNDIITRYLPQT